MIVTELPPSFSSPVRAAQAAGAEPELEASVLILIMD
jgi:hypothetical protein